MAKLVCWNCGASLADVPLPISRHATCSECFEVLHCCRLCRFYAPGRPQDCDHEKADPPVEKESANFCEYFSPRPNAHIPKERQAAEGAKSRLSALFGEEEASPEDDDTGKPVAAPDDTDEAKRKLDDLFDD